MRPVSEVIAPETLDRIDLLDPNPRPEPRHRNAGPAYGSIEIFGFNVDPRDATRAKVPSIRFNGTDSQYQEVLDKSNVKIAKREASRPSKLDVQILKLQTKIRMMQVQKIRELERLVRIAETVERYSRNV